MLYSLRIVDELTFDCRWWNTNNSNQDKCKTAFNTYAAGTFFTILIQISLIAIVVVTAEKDKKAEWSHIADGQQSHGSDQPREVQVEMA